MKSLAHIPADIGCAADYEWLAQRFIAPPTYAYIAGGSGRDVTARANVAAYADWSVVPRVLRDLRDGHTQVGLGGSAFDHPILLAPVAHQRLVHPQAEIEAARASAAADTCLIASTLSSCSLEEIAAAAGPHKWFQLYFQPSRNDTAALLDRAERAGYGAIVVTVDAPLQVPSTRAQRAGFRWPEDCRPANLAATSATPDAPPVARSRIFQGAMRGAPVWSDLEWLRSAIALPVWVKGVMHPDDAVQLQSSGAAGIVVSNHGGRALDGAPASLHVLPQIRAAVGSDFPILFDGGVRSGNDVFKALALGADAVLIGRLQVYAASVAGALGVAHLIKLLREELEICMALAGCATLSDIGPQCLLPRPANGATDVAGD